MADASSGATILQHARSVPNNQLDSRRVHWGPFTRAVEIRDSGDPRLWILSLVVEPAWRRRGLGTALLGAAVSFAKSSDLTTLRLIFSRRNWALRQLALKTNARLDIVLEELRADISLRPKHRMNLDQQGRAS
jgi:GNAT superfamily N-acetyltransferase